MLPTRPARTGPRRAPCRGTGRRWSDRSDRDRVGRGIVAIAGMQGDGFRMLAVGRHRLSPPGSRRTLLCGPASVEWSEGGFLVTSSYAHCGRGRRCHRIAADLPRGEHGCTEIELSKGRREEKGSEDRQIQNIAKKAVKPAKRPAAGKKKAAKKKALAPRKKRPTVVRAAVSPAVADLDQRIAIVRNNLRDLTGDGRGVVRRLERRAGVGAHLRAGRAAPGPDQAARGPRSAAKVDDQGVSFPARCLRGGGRRHPPTEGSWATVDCGP